MRSRAVGLVVVCLSLVLGCTAEDEFAQQSSEAVVAPSGAIARGSTWAYWDGGGDLGTAWRGGGYNDGSWKRGAGPLGYGETYLATTVGYGGNPSSKHITTYFRAQFTVDDPAAVTAMRGELMFDDGAVVYLNGQEIGRASMPTGTITAATRALGHEANGYQTYDWNAHRPLLRAGVNTIAVEVHQADASSSDLVFDLGLVITVAPPPMDDDIPPHATWAYWDKGGDLGTAWRSASFDDSGWARGAAPLGYGEPWIATPISYGSDPANKHITTYFRRELWADDPDAITDILGQLNVDDGCVVYVNGVELVRHWMPTGPITASTRAQNHEGYDDNFEDYYYTPMRDYLVPGRNVVAVEVHQASASSSDLTFDLAITVGTSDREPTLRGIPSGSTWGYWDKGGDLGTAWRQESYEEVGWKAGAAPLGYGESYIATATQPRVTTYFRHQFNRYGSPSGWALEAKYDDGFIAYLNGVEVLRVRMPAGPVTASTLATGHEAGTYERFELPGAEALVHDGLNTLAIEVHQASASSSDLVWDTHLVPSNTWPEVWTRQDSETIQSLWDVAFTDAQHGWVIGLNGIVLRTVDGGVTWTTVAPPGSGELCRKVQFADAMHGWIACQGELRATTDGGETWSVQSTITAYDLDFASATTGWLAAGTRIYGTTDGGATWQVQFENTEYSIGNVSFADASHGWASAKFDGCCGPEVNGADIVLHTTDGGTTWTRQFATGGWEQSIGDIDAISPTLAWFVGNGSNHTALGEYKYVTRDGATWTAVPDSTNRTSLHDVEFIDANIGFAVGYAGSIVRTVDGGATWTVDETARWHYIPDHTDPERPSVNAVHMLDAQHGWAVGDSGTILRLGD
jgi:photosystem II stability/assembly factor-like uncharacterized protein